MNPIFIGIFPPDLSTVLLPIIVAGIVGSLLCYANRFLAYIVIPAFLVFCVYQINYLEFFTNLISGYMFFVYSTMLLSLIGMSAAVFVQSKKNGKIS